MSLPLYLIDKSLADYTTLIAALPEGATYHLLEPDQNGIDQLTAIVSQYQDVDALHLFSHGAAGTVQLGSTQLDASTLAEHQESLQAVGSQLTEDADLLIYGCDVAADESGKSFLVSLSEVMGVDVAASENITGSGSDWDLEYQYGSVESETFSLSSYTGTLALPGAHSATQNGEVFLGGNYIELGINAVGSFGTINSAPANFFGTGGSSRIGMSNDADGFDNGLDLRIDYFLPGTPEERWAIGFNGNVTGSYSALTGSDGVSLTQTSLTNNSSGDVLSATFSGVVGSTLRVEQTYIFQEDDKFFKTTVRLTNITDSELTDVRYMRSFDPDNTQYAGGSYTTINEVENTYATDGNTLVSATSLADAYSAATGSPAKVFLFSDAPNTYGANFGFTNTNPYGAPEQAKGYTTTSDSAIAIVHKGGTLDAGDTLTFEYYVSKALENEPSLAAIQAAPPSFIGKVIDGYVSGAALYVDVNEDGVADANESTGATTNANGGFAYLGALSGPLITVGGTNTDTGIENPLTLSAPEDSYVVTPITTLIYQYSRDHSVDTATAETAVQDALGITGNVDLTQFDSLVVENELSLAVQSKIAQIATLGILAEEADIGFNTVISNMSELIHGGESLDLVDSSMIDYLMDTPYDQDAMIEQAVTTNLDIAGADSFDEITDAQSELWDDWFVDGERPATPAPTVLSEIWQDFSLVQKTQAAYIAFYGRPADPGGLDSWSSSLEQGGGSLESIISAFSTSDEFTGRFGALSDGDLVNAIYQQCFNRDAEQSGLDYYTGLLERGERSFESIALDILFGAQGSDADIVINKLAFADAFTQYIESGSDEYAGNEHAEIIKEILLDISPQTTEDAFGLLMTRYSQAIAGENTDQADWLSDFMDGNGNLADAFLDAEAGLNGTQEIGLTGNNPELIDLFS
ncbi:MAG: hypothetical protein CMI01_11705 [Oceanospirillaceae bacterium]|nr:hypothetical protein [Oceanospirillaceae bacterium]